MLNVLQSCDLSMQRKGKTQLSSIRDMRNLFMFTHWNKSKYVHEKCLRALKKRLRGYASQRVFSTISAAKHLQPARQSGESGWSDFGGESIWPSWLPLLSRLNRTEGCRKNQAITTRKRKISSIRIRLFTAAALKRWWSKRNVGIGWVKEMVR